MRVRKYERYINDLPTFDHFGQIQKYFTKVCITSNIFKFFFQIS